MLKWWQKNIVYQIYPKSFLDTTGKGTGDINGITRKLDYLKDLGVGALWLCPVYPSPNIDNGYDISNYTDIDKNFGSMKDFDELVKQAGERNIKIVMDLVFNHTSDQHEWFKASKQNRTNDKADWYIWREGKPDGSAPTNWRSIFGGSSWEFCEERQQYYLHTFAKEQPDLNWENPEVRRALYDAANFWLEKGVGGFRIDAITYIKKPKIFQDGAPDGKDGTVSVHTMTANTLGILDFLHEMKDKVFSGHDIFTVGEAYGVTADELPLWVGDKGVFDMLFEFSHVELSFDDVEIWCRPCDWNLLELKRALFDCQENTKNNGWCPVFWENHDQPRSISKFLPFANDKQKAAKVLAAVLLTMRGTPFIYQGEELGMCNVSWDDIKIYDDISTKGQYDFAINEGFSPSEAIKFVQMFSRDNARTPMQWNAEKNAGFSTGKSWLPVNENYTSINAEKEAHEKNSVLSFYKKLIALRKNHEALTAGDIREIFSESGKIFAFERNFDGEKITTLANFSNEKIKLPEEFSTRKILLSSEENINPLELSPLEARIYA